MEGKSTDASGVRRKYNNKIIPRPRPPPPAPPATASSQPDLPNPATRSVEGTKNRLQESANPICRVLARRYPGDDEFAGRLLFLCCMEKEGCWQAGQVIHVASTW